MHKNFELLVEASRLLERRLGKGVFETVFTVSGQENKYASWLREQWGGVASLRFAGFQSPSDLQSLYASSDCLVFPSRIETWGLPISEFMPYDRPMLLSDLPYAHETSTGARRVAFGQHLCYTKRFDNEVPEYVLMDAAQKFYANLITPL